MKFTTSKTNLFNTLQKVAKAVSLKAPLPVLEGILFEVHNNYLTVTATNLDISIQCTTKINGFRDGSIVLPSRYITEIVRRLPDTGEVEVESNDLNVYLRYYVKAGSPSHSQQDTVNAVGPARSDAGGQSTLIPEAYHTGLSEAVIQGFNSSSFPSFPPISNLKGLLSIKAGLLSEALKQVLFAVSSDESRPVFTGVLFQLFQKEQGEGYDEKKFNEQASGTGFQPVVDRQDAYPTSLCHGFLKLVATDTHRLVCKTLASKLPAGRMPTLQACHTESDACNLIPDAAVGQASGRQDAHHTALSNIIVPGKNLNELSRILNQTPEEEVEISLGDSQIFFIIKSAEKDEQEIYPTILVSRLIAGKFPLYQQVIPLKFIFSVSLKTQELKAAVERAMLFTRENISLVNLSFIRQASCLSKCIISTKTEAGGVKETLTVGQASNLLTNDRPEGQASNLSEETCPTCSIYFNAHYLVEALRAILTEEVYLNITGPLSAMVMYPVARHEKDTELTDYLSLLLPARYEE
jgi:DNA polymerase-3 subunit beta